VLKGQLNVVLVDDDKAHIYMSRFGADTL